ncbi:MAG: hypothetical protein JO192_09910 [Candidatus Eremiobacteraeota bacterium]|nr:hypothetical protein [Candidatus Eremiobacteraeota bacterium]
MMTQALEISVLSAPLAAIDRRALSQAWYSALHVARSGRSRGEPIRKRAAQTPSKARTARPPAQHEPRAIASRRRGATSAAKDGRRFGFAAERRAVPSRLSRDIERALFAPRARNQAIVMVDGRRVCVSIAAGASGVRIVAVCRPAIRDAVARALAQARFALAARCIPCS